MRYSAAAVLTVDDRYVLQLRDNSAAIAFPGHWGLFGGEVKQGETPLEAIRREIHEELTLDVLRWCELGVFPYHSVSGESSRAVRRPRTRCSSPWASASSTGSGPSSIVSASAGATS